MKLNLPASVAIKGPNGETIQVSAAHVIEHVVRTGRDLGLSSDVEKVRRGARILAAVAAGSASQTGEIDPADVEALKKGLSKPSRGWASIPVEIEMPAAPGVNARTVRRQMTPNALDLLPLIDGLLAA